MIFIPRKRGVFYTTLSYSVDCLELFALPIERDNATSLNIVRVPLNIAISFITKLEGRINKQQHYRIKLCKIH